MEPKPDDKDAPDPNSAWPADWRARTHGWETRISDSDEFNAQQEEE